MLQLLKSLYHSLLPERQRNRLRSVGYRLRGLWYVGSARFCVVCGRSARRFLPFGHARRPDAACPHCQSLERTRVLWYYLAQETPLFQTPLRVLHFAPEPQLAKRLRRVHGSGYYSADLNPQLADHPQDIQHLTLADGAFDWVICAHVLGHVPDEAQAMRELHRVLAPGGTALVLTLQDHNLPHTYSDASHDTPPARLAAYGEPDLLRRHGLDFAQRLVTAGFEVTQVDYRTHFSAADRTRFALGDGSRERIWVCRKP